jgi:hypothetical protein
MSTDGGTRTPNSTTLEIVALPVELHPLNKKRGRSVAIISPGAAPAQAFSNRDLRGGSGHLPVAAATSAARSGEAVTSTAGHLRAIARHWRGSIVPGPECWSLPLPFVVPITGADYVLDNANTEGRDQEPIYSPPASCRHARSV